MLIHISHGAGGLDLDFRSDAVVQFDMQGVSKQSFPQGTSLESMAVGGHTSEAIYFHPLLSPN